MFLTLLAVTFVVSAICAFAVSRIFARPLRTILNRIVSDELGHAWHRYITFALFIVGISGGVRIWQLEKYIAPGEDPIPVLNADRWVLEIYRTVIGSLQSVAMMLLVVFLITLIAFVIVRVSHRGAEATT